MQLSPPLSEPLRHETEDWPSDEALLSGLSGGVWGAGRALVRRHQRRVYGLALSIMGDPHQAEEIAHETFLRAWRDARSYEPERASVSTWLLTITRDLARSSPERNRGRPVDAATLIPMSQRDDRSTRTESTNDFLRERAGLSELPVEQGRALVLAAIYGYTAREISEMDSIPLDTAKARLRSGLAMLRARLGHAPAAHEN